MYKFTRLVEDVRSEPGSPHNLKHQVGKTPWVNVPSRESVSRRHARQAPTVGVILPTNHVTTCVQILPHQIPHNLDLGAGILPKRLAQVHEMGEDHDEVTIVVGKEATVEEVDCP